MADFSFARPFVFAVWARPRNHAVHPLVNQGNDARKVRVFAVMPFVDVFLRYRFTLEIRSAFWAVCWLVFHFSESIILTRFAQSAFAMLVASFVTSSSGISGR